MGKVRIFLIQLLAGKSMVLLNAKFKLPGEAYISAINVSVKHLVAYCDFDPTDTPVVEFDPATKDHLTRYLRIAG